MFSITVIKEQAWDHYDKLTTDIEAVYAHNNKTKMTKTLKK
jgi:hypothetical protein